MFWALSVQKFQLHLTLYEWGLINDSLCQSSLRIRMPKKTQKKTKQDSECQLINFQWEIKLEK